MAIASAASSKKTKRRLLIVTSDFAVNADGTYRPGGLQQFSRCVFRALATCSAIERLDGWTLLDDPGGAAFLERSYIARDARARAISVRGFAGNRRRMALAYVAHAGAYDLSMFLHVGVGRLAVLRPGAPVCVWLVGIEVRRPLRWIERQAVLRASPLLSISAFSSDEMIRHNPRLPPARTVHLCVEPDGAWGGAEISGPLAYDPSTRERAVLIVARMVANERYKGHDQLIDAWPEVLEQCPGARLWVVGSGDDADRLRARAAALGDSVRRQIDFLGKLSHDDLQRAYGRARVFAMPSTGEGFGLVFVEAMQAGLPCICGRDSAKEIVLDGVTGFVVDQERHSIARACVRLLTDDAIARRMSSSGVERVAARFTFSAFRERLLEELGLPSGVE